MSATIHPEHELGSPARSGVAAVWNELVVENPMLDQAKREQRRFFRSAYGLGKFGPLIIITLIAFLYAWLLLETVLSRTDGTAIYSYIELVLLTLTLPASIYGAISAERERSTWDALILTRLTPAQIIAGKLVWRIKMILWDALLLTLPILASRVNWSRIGVIQGQVPPISAVVAAQTLVICWGVLVCAFGLWVSALTRRSITSLAVIAVLLLTFLLIVPAVYATIAAVAITGWNGSNQPDVIFNWMISFNPFIELNAVISPYPMQNTGLPNAAFTGWIQSVGYLALSSLLIIATNQRLKWLEEPGLKSR